VRSIYYLLSLLLIDRAWNKVPNYFHFQGKEMQDQEWYNGSGLEQYDFGARYYDPQLGRWNTQDAAGQYASPYVGMGNNWPNGMDPTGKNFWSDLGDAAAFLLNPVGYMGASMESDGKIVTPVSKWNSNWWKGAITADLIVASAIVGVEAVAPASWGIATSSTLFGIEGGAAIGVAQSIAPTLITDWAMKKAPDPNTLFSDAVSGAISGAFQSNAMQHWIDGMNGANVPGSGWLRIIKSWEVPTELQGVTSNVIGAVLSNGVKNYLSYGANGNWKGIDGTLIGDGIAGGVGQVFHQLTTMDDFYSSARYVQPIFSNLYSAFWQEFLSPGNLKDMGDGDFSSWGNNFLANWIGGYASDAFSPDNSHSSYYSPGIMDFGDPDTFCVPDF
jgi:RHS repeat-associated protein